MGSSKVLIIAPECISHAAGEEFQNAGYYVARVTDRDHGVQKAQHMEEGLVIVALHADMESLYVLGELGKNPAIAVVFILLDGEADERMTEMFVRIGLEFWGVQGYARFPIEEHELLVRGEKAIRCHQKRGMLEVGDLKVWPSRRFARLRERGLPLTPTEFDLFVVLLENTDEVLSREEIWRKAHGDDYLEGTDRPFDTHLTSMRRKLEEGGSSLEIRTVRGLGYQLALKEEVSG